MPTEAGAIGQAASTSACTARTPALAARRRASTDPSNPTAPRTLDAPSPHPTSSTTPRLSCPASERFQPVCSPSVCPPAAW